MEPKILNQDSVDFVTVVSVGSETSSVTKEAGSSDDTSTLSPYVTVLTIGEEVPNEVSEEVLVYRLPGERLGFGLKFEGGTKAAEFVKRLFIQSCAPDSPASRVRCSWGKLAEGDEVIEIDSIPVNSMTRIDCVRCLKDSNVVIKLLIKHVNACGNGDDLPQVISAEKKRSPPPPPPVPPRKIPRKLYKDNGTNASAKASGEKTIENCPPTPPTRHVINEPIASGNKNARFQSPRSSGRRNVSEVPTRDRRISDGSIGPPDPEVYTDLFLQESTCSLSESDDTGSSISTVVDRLGSSLSGSLPSTPTSMQRHLDLSQLNLYEDDVDFDEREDYLVVQIPISSEFIERGPPDLEKFPTQENSALQPPTCFQDAPLSYGNETVKVAETLTETPVKLNGTDNHMVNGLSERNVAMNMNGFVKNDLADKRPPPPPPRAKNTSLTSLEKNKNGLHSDENGNCTKEVTDLPRLVDFVPKSNKLSASEPIEIMRMFLENEKRVSSDCSEKATADCYDGAEQCNVDFWREEVDYYSFGWSPSSQLATIGEDEEEGNQEFFPQRSPNAPIVIIESADCDKTESDHIDICKKEASTKDEDEHATRDVQEAQLETNNVQRTNETDSNMDAPPTYSRQPPDGHEFPDYQETQPIEKTAPTDFSDEFPASKRRWEVTSSRDYQSSCSVRDKIAIFSNQQLNSSSGVKACKSTEDVFNGIASAYCDNDLSNSKTMSKSVMSLDNLKSSLNDPPLLSSDCKSKDLFHTNKAVNPENPVTTRLHTRSQSLSDMSTISDRRNGSDRWSLLVEQRKRGLSKLKGLVIPEHAAETDVSARPVVDIPEIKTNSSTVIPLANGIKAPPRELKPQVSTPCFVEVPQWTPPPNVIPKYSPAFKRKSLQVYSSNGEKTRKSSTEGGKVDNPRIELLTEKPKNATDTSLSVNDAPKSLESITSPTRSDCSFEYNSSSPELKLTGAPRTTLQHGKDDIGRSEDESDNDSAVSSSQSSYISRSSPPASPNHLHFSSRTCNMLEADLADRQRRTGFQQESQVTSKYDSLNRRLLKPQSVEAINRKNILASAKCRSGRDLKAGSPLIQRKFDEDKHHGADENHPKPNDDNQCPAGDKKEVTVVDQPRVEERLNGITVPIANDVATPKSKLLSNETSSHQQAVIKKERVLPIEATNHLLDKKISSISALPRCLSANVRTASVNDLKKNFEKLAPPPVLKEPSKLPTAKRRISKETIDTRSPIKSPVATNEKIQPKEDPEVLIKTVLDEIGEPIAKKNVKVVVLRPEIPGGSVGITLAGGTDYEIKEISVHKVRNNSVAHRDGQLQKGDRILSINGHSMKGLTHEESVAILKKSTSEVTIVACQTTSKSDDRKPKIENAKPAAKTRPSAASPLPSADKKHDEVTLVKDMAGLGFSVEGGHDSPAGDLPLVVKKIFTGGAAEKCGKLKPGDELQAINGVDVSCMSRIEAWTFMKKLPEGEVLLKIRR